MNEPASGEVVRQIIGADLTDEETAALVDWYTNLARGVARFPATDLEQVEPPLRSVPGPSA